MDWNDPAALTQLGERETTEPWAWAGPARAVTGRTWGGCIEVIHDVLMVGRFPADPGVLWSGVLLLETSEEVIPALDFSRLLRALGERGLLACWPLSTPCWWHVHRPGTGTTDPRAMSVRHTVPSNETSRSNC